MKVTVDRVNCARQTGCISQITLTGYSDLDFRVVNEVRCLYYICSSLDLNDLLTSTSQTPYECTLRGTTTSASWFTTITVPVDLYINSSTPL